MWHLAALALTGALVMAGAGPAAAVALKGDQRTAQLRAAPKHAKWQAAQTSKTAAKAVKKTSKVSRKASRASELAQGRPRHSCP
jgi:hypothetical protein